MSDYWKEHAEIAMEEAGIESVSPEQLDAIAGVIESAHEFYGQAHGHDVASQNRRAAIEDEHEQEKRELRKEIERLENDIHIFRQSVARRRGCDVNNVDIERYGKGRGDVIYSYR